MRWNKTLQLPSLLSAVLFLSAAGTFTAIARGDTYTWANAGTSWTTASDWNPQSGPPGSNDVALFNLGSYSFQPSLSAASSASGIWDAGGGAVTISGSGLTLAAGAALNGNAATGIELDAGAGSLSIASALTLGNSQTWINNAAAATGPLTVSGNVAEGVNLLTIGGSGSTTISGVLSGSVGLTVNGPGLVTLTNAANSYNGTTTINGGTLAASTWNNNFGDSSLGIGNYIVFNGGMLLYTGTEAPANAYARYLTLDAGGGTVTTTAASHFWPVQLSGSGSLTIDCAAGGQFNCNGVSTCSDTLTLVAGELQARSSLAYGTATIVVDGGEFGATSGSNSSNVDNNVTILANPPVGPALEFHDVIGMPTFSGVIALDSSATAIGAGNGNNSISMTITGLLTGSGGLQLLEYGSGATGRNAPVYIAGSQSNTYAGPTLLTGSLQGLDAYLYLANTSGYALSGTNVTFAAVGRSHLAIAAAGQQIPPDAAMTFLSSGGTSVGYFQLEGYSQTVAGLNGATGFGIVEASESSSVAGPATLTLDGTGSYSFDGTLRDHSSGTATLSLVVAGSGIQTLAGSNSYSGGTAIESGTLQVGNTAALGAGALAVNGGTLDLAGYSIAVPSFSGAISYMSGTEGTVTDSGSAAAALTLTQTGTTSFGGTIGDGAGKTSLALTGGGTLVLAGENTYTGGTMVGKGTLILANSESIADGSSLTVGNEAAFGAIIAAADGIGAGTAEVGSGSNEMASPAAAIAPVLEPGALALLAFGLGSAALYCRLVRRPVSREKSERRTATCRRNAPV